MTWAFFMSREAKVYMESPDTPRALLESGCQRLAMDVSSDALDRLLAYVDQLQRWNRAYNLTAVRDIRQMIIRHVLDSLVIAPHVHQELLDIGSGPGLPGIPLAIVRPEMPVHLVESNGKRVHFLRAVVRDLALSNVEIRPGRVEALQLAHPSQGSIVCRAFSSLYDFVRVTARLGTKDAHWLAMKGRLDRQELQKLPAGFRLLSAHRMVVPLLEEERHLVVVGYEGDGSCA